MILTTTLILATLKKTNGKTSLIRQLDLWIVPNGGEMLPRRSRRKCLLYLRNLAYSLLPVVIVWCLPFVIWLKVVNCMLTWLQIFGWIFNVQKLAPSTHWLSSSTLLTGSDRRLVVLITSDASSNQPLMAQAFGTSWRTIASVWWSAHSMATPIIALASCNGIQPITKGRDTLKAKAASMSSHRQMILLVVPIMLAVFIGIKWSKSISTSGMTTNMLTWVSFAPSGSIFFFQLLKGHFYFNHYRTALEDIKTLEAELLKVQSELPLTPDDFYRNLGEEREYLHALKEPSPTVSHKIKYVEALHNLDCYWYIL